LEFDSLNAINYTGSKATKTFAKGVIAYCVDSATEFGKLKGKKRQFADAYKKIVVKHSSEVLARFMNRIETSNYSDARMRQTGSIDARRLANYRTSDSIFHRRLDMPNNVNHAVVMLLDFSSSMRRAVQGLIIQCGIVCEFCHNAGIPFKVIGYGWDNRVAKVCDSDDYSLNSMAQLFDVSMLNWTKNPGIFVSNGYTPIALAALEGLKEVATYKASGIDDVVVFTFTDGAHTTVTSEDFSLGGAKVRLAAMSKRGSAGDELRCAALDPDDTHISHISIGGVRVANPVPFKKMETQNCSFTAAQYRMMMEQYGAKVMMVVGVHQLADYSIALEYCNLMSEKKLGTNDLEKVLVDAAGLLVRFKSNFYNAGVGVSELKPASAIGKFMTGKYGLGQTPAMMSVKMTGYFKSFVKIIADAMVGA
jgi:hypothetical protein